MHEILKASRTKAASQALLSLMITANTLHSIIRILFTVSVYAVSSFLKTFYYKHAIYIDLAANAYAAVALSSFLALLKRYVAPDLHGQKEYFRTLKPRRWTWPLTWLCCVPTPTSGLTWFNVLKPLGWDGRAVS